MSWSREQVNLLIEEYKKHPCLYVVKSEAYKNKHARNEALYGIANILGNIRTGVTIAEVKCKFAALRQNFLVEHRKHIKSLKSGAGTEQVYIPSIWYYELMFFIIEHVIPKPATFDSIADRVSELSNENIENLENTELDTQWDLHDQLDFPDETILIEDTPSTSPRNTKASKKKIEREYLSDATTALNRIATVIVDNHNVRGANTTSKSPDDIDAFLQYLSVKLRRITDNDVLYETENDILQLVQNKCKKN